MTDRGVASGSGANACPFLAFEDDRDRRSVEPDTRHRCYAQVHPALPTATHQRSFCLSDAFPACPIFQDWAVRAAAQGVSPRRGAPHTSGATPAASPTAPSVAADVAGASPSSSPPPDARETLPASLAVSSSNRDEERTVPLLGERDDARSDRGAGAPDSLDDTSYTYLPASERRGRSLTDEGVSPPAFLAARDRPTSSGSGAAPFRAEPSDASAPVAPAAPQARPLGALATRRSAPEREAPVWERSRRFEPYPALHTRMGLRRVPRLLLALGALLVGAALLFLVPAFLFRGNSGGTGARPTGTTTTTTASPPAGSAGAIVPGSGAVSASASATASSGPTQRVYVVRAGDTLSKIARSQGVTVEQLLAANPQIKDANRIRQGDQLFIPDENFSVPPSARGSPRAPSASP